MTLREIMRSSDLGAQMQMQMPTATSIWARDEKPGHTAVPADSDSAALNPKL